MTKIERLKAWIMEAKTLVIFTGAGISTPSGIPDFRSSQDRSFEDILTYGYMIDNKDSFTNYVFKHLYYPFAKPNLAHLYFAELERKGKVTSLVTQNIDDLHMLAGQKRVYPIHGSIHKWYCMKCEKEYDPLKLDHNHANYCSCGGFIRPNITLYGEPLDEAYYHLGLTACQVADLLIVVGSSLSVEPAASMVRYASQRLVIINKDNTKYDRRADLVFHEDIIDVIHKLSL
jgi:NAD-dependent deacetylase